MADNAEFSEDCPSGSQDDSSRTVDSSQQNAPPPPYTSSFKHNEKPPPYPGTESQLNTSHEQTVWTLQPPPAYPGFPERRIIMQQPGITTCQQMQGNHQATVVIAEPTYPPPNHMCLACTVMWFCCLPLGLVSVYFSCMVQDRYSRGHYQGAASASNRARIWGNVGFFIGLCFWTFMMVWLFI